MIKQLNSKIRWIFFFLLISQHAVGQQRSFGKNFIFEVIGTERKTMVRQPYVSIISDTSLSNIFSKFGDSDFSQMAPKSPLLLGVKLNPSLQRYFSGTVYAQTKEYPVYLISDSSDATLVALGITKQNYKSFQYRIVENDSSELVKWSPIPNLEQQYGAKQPYGAIGKFNYPGKRIMVEIAHKDNYSLRDGVVFDWRVNYKPILEQIVISTPDNYFNLQAGHLNRGYATWSDRDNLPKNFSFPVDSVRRILFQFKKQETLVHSVSLIRNIEGKKDTIWIGFLDARGNVELTHTHFKRPGNYDLVVQQQTKQLRWTEAELVRISFDVTAPRLANINYWLPYLIGLIVLIIVLFIAYGKYNKNKLAKLNRQRQQAQLQLKTIRAQLNPHFIFNALSSIQNLINKDQILDANIYLAKFADLTRKVLITSEQELISLAEELKIAEDYLKLEQLRFGFTYRLNIADTLPTQNIDVPAILLQPFIENAVKHGISRLKEKGSISINVVSEHSNLKFTISDNGKGFSQQQAMEKVGSYGLKLCKQRLDLLNQVYKSQPATLHIQSDEEGTVIILELKNWIANGN
jgi:two-component system LytT family sensor kinase